MEDRPKHLAVRIPMTGESLENIVGKHNAVVSLKGSVWFGGRGQTPKEARLTSLLQQIRSSIPTFLYLAQRKTRTIQTFQSPILSVAHSVPPEDLQLIPEYYGALGGQFKAAIWLKLGQFREVPYSALRLLQVEKTGSPVAYVLTKSMASILIDVEGEFEATPPTRRRSLFHRGPQEEIA